MADSVTPNYALIKPENTQSRDTWGLKTNGNWDKVDAALTAIAGDVSALDGVAIIAKINAAITANPAIVANSTRLNGQPASYYLSYANMTGSISSGSLPSNVLTTSNYGSVMAYQGSSNTNLSFPVGSYVMVQVDTPVARNGVITPTLGTSGVSGIVNGGSGGSLTGSWRARGKSPDNLIQLAQRIS